jgi:hypothetical protein
VLSFGGMISKTEEENALSLLVRQNRMQVACIKSELRRIEALSLVLDATFGVEIFPCWLGFAQASHVSRVNTGP